MSWLPREKGLANLLKLKSGESVKGILRGKPYCFKQHWVGGRGALCEGQGCPHCSQKDENGKPNYPGFRFRVNFLTSENGQYVAKVFEQGGKVYDKIMDLSTEYDIDKTQVKITRYGSDTQTTYEVTPLADWKVSADLEKKLKDISLNELSHTAPREPSEDEGETGDIPF